VQCVPSFFASREVAAGCHHWLDSDRGVVVSLITRAHFNPQQLALDSTWTISVYGTLGTLYDVLIAFVVTGVWQSFSAAETAVNSEANALTDLVFLIRYISAATTSTFARRQDRMSRVLWSDGICWVSQPAKTKPLEEINIASPNAVVDAILGVKPEGDRELELYGKRSISRQSGLTHGAIACAAPRATLPARSGACSSRRKRTRLFSASSSVVPQNIENASGL
jgi:hypothetical protein